MKQRISKVWWIITAISQVNLNMILFSIKSPLKQLLMIFSVNLQMLFLPARVQKKFQQIPSHPRPKSQLEKFREEHLIRIETFGEKAYWIKDHTFFEAEIVDGKVDLDSAHPLDTEILTDEQAEALFTVIDKLGSA